MTPGQLLDMLLAREDFDLVTYRVRRRHPVSAADLMAVHSFTVERREEENRLSQSFHVRDEFLHHARPEVPARMAEKWVASLLTDAVEAKD